MRAVLLLGGLCLFMALIVPDIAVAQIEWQEQAIADNFDGAACVCAADVDGDGDVDVLGSAMYADDITWWENLDGVGGNWAEHTVDGAFDYAATVCAVDMDGDGDVDMLGAAMNADDVSWWENLDGSGHEWSEHSVDDSIDGIYTVCAADVDGDGDVDVLGAAGLADQFSWWENLDGVGTNWAEHIVDGNYNAAQRVFATDMDGDGDIDVLGATGEHDLISWWENMDGGGLDWDEHTIVNTFDLVCGIFAADMDGDGDTDVLGSAFFGDDIAWWENLDGEGTNWAQHYVSETFDGAYDVCAADINGDGDMDVLGASGNANLITYWENLDGHGLEWSTNVIDANFPGAFWVCAFDVDSDNDLDVLGAAIFGDDITVWFQEGSPGLIDIRLTPAVEPTIVPRGSSFEYNALIHSNLPSLQYVDFWTEAVLPNNNTYGPIWLINDFPVGPGTIINARAIMQFLPATAPLGQYTFRMKAGFYPGLVGGTDEFMLEVINSASVMNQPAFGWGSNGHQEAFMASDQTENGKVRDQAGDLSFTVSPNPFNAVTAITITLQGASQLNMTVFNTNGQQVAELANGSYTAGTHELSFNANNLASGLYFVRAAVPGQFEQMQKVMFVR